MCFNLCLFFWSLVLEYKFVYIVNVLLLNIFQKPYLWLFHSLLTFVKIIPASTGSAYQFRSRSHEALGPSMRTVQVNTQKYFNGIVIVTVRDRPLMTSRNFGYFRLPPSLSRFLFPRLLVCYRHELLDVLISKAMTSFWICPLIIYPC